VPRRSHANLGQDGRLAARWTGNLPASHGLGRLLHSERPDKLLEEERYSVFELRVGRSGCGPLSDLSSATIDQRSLLSGNKFV